MYVCPSCRSFFKTGSPGKKIKCLKCKNDYLADLKITDEEWRKLDPDARKSRINRAIAGEQLREEIPKPKKPVRPIVSNDSTDEEAAQDKIKNDLPDEAILEAQKLLEEQDMQAEMPRQPVDRGRFMIVCTVAACLITVLSVMSFVLPIFRMREETGILEEAMEGDIVSYGKYKGNTEWTVLERNEDDFLVVGNYAVVSALPESIRDRQKQTEWLNSAYMNKAFNIYERRRILVDEDTGESIHFMSDREWTQYSDLVGSINDGKAHPICRISLSDNSL